MRALYEEILNVLDVVAFRKQSDDHFKPLSPMPAWISEIYAMETGENINFSELSPFLENFFIDAEPHWQSGKQSRISSGVWTEFDHNNQQHQLEAYAFSVEGTPLLLIMDLSKTFRDRYHVYQKAREIALENEQLVVELHLRQRQLQSQLEQQLGEPTPFEKISTSVMENSSAVLICEPDGTVQVINKALVNIYRFDLEHDHKMTSMLDQWIKEAEKLYPEIKRVLASGSYWEGEFESSDITGKGKWIRLTIGPVVDDLGSISHYICIANDISEIRKSSRELEKLTDFDLITQLPNRHSFWKKMTWAVDECTMNKRRLVLFYIDLDHFKRVNESLGHHAGDFLLCTIATRIKHCVKKVDVIAHLGGDEFAVIAMIEKVQDMENVALRMLDAIRPTVSIEKSDIRLTASIGIACFPRDGHDATTLMKHADLAMFFAKEQGRNQYQFYEPTISNQFLSRLNLEKDLDLAIEQKQFELYYQPQICLNKDPYIRIEALIRWQHPDQGLLGPVKFIPFAEETGQVQQIGDWVLNQACEQAREFLDQGLDVIIAINISASQLRRGDFTDLVESSLSRYELDPKHLELEITETCLLGHMEPAIEALTHLRKKGVTISLDDFGTGFSSLNYLKSLPVDNLKIDQSFVRELLDDENSQAITSSIIRLAHELKMRVIAEGVETKEQLAFLKTQNCDYFQGYLFQRPMALAQLKEYISGYGGNGVKDIGGTI